ncbi:MAG: hypothetical protein ACI9LM_002084 [Alteromonadaceae bacterium]|jgi:hypothetical protein
MLDNKSKECTEFAVFKVCKENIRRVAELSKAIFTEMNAEEKVISSFQILQKIDNEEELCWHLTWVSAEAAKTTTEKWPSFPSTKAFQSLVDENKYYGHFVDLT